MLVTSCFNLCTSIKLKLVLYRDQVNPEKIFINIWLTILLLNHDFSSELWYVQKHRIDEERANPLVNQIWDY